MEEFGRLVIGDCVAAVEKANHFDQGMQLDELKIRFEGGVRP